MSKQELKETIKQMKLQIKTLQQRLILADFGLADIQVLRNRLAEIERGE